MSPLSSDRMSSDRMSSDQIVTIVTPSYNQGQFIRTTIESVLSQDYPNVEYIVMDGGSTDQTASIVSEYASRLTFVSERDSGQSQAINKGFRRGSGAILAWLNSDDVYLPGAISTAVRALSTHPGAGMVYGEGYTIDREGKIQGRFPHSRPFDLWRLTYLSDYILQQSSYFRREALDQVGYLDEQLHYGMDWDIFVRIGMRYPVQYIPEYLGCIREHDDTKSSRGSVTRARELHALLRKHTGMRIPPGSIVYGGETVLRRLWRTWLERHTPPGSSEPSRAQRADGPANRSRDWSLGQTHCSMRSGSTQTAGQGIGCGSCCPVETVPSRFAARFPPGRKDCADSGSRSTPTGACWEATRRR